MSRRCRTSLTSTPRLMEPARAWAMCALAGLSLGTAAADVVVPAHIDTTWDANFSDNTNSLLDSGDEVHYQLLIAEAAVGLLPGDEITGMAWRKDVQPPFGNVWPSPDATWSQYDVTIAQAATSVATMSDTFATNMLNPVLVRSGSLTIPAGSFSNTSSGPEANTFYQAISFTTPYTYQGGDLVIDIVRSVGNGSIRLDGADRFTNSKFFSAFMSYSSTQLFADDYASAVITKLITNPGSTVPANDACVFARSVINGGTYKFDTSLATIDGSSSCSASGKDVWFAYTAPADIPTGLMLNFSATADAMSPVLSAYDGSCAGSSIGCAFSGSSTCELDVAVNPGQTIVVRVAGSGSSSGAGLLRVALHPLNDRCDHALSIDSSGGIYSFDAAYARVQIPKPSVCVDSHTWLTYPLWYEYIAPLDTADKIELQLSASRGGADYADITLSLIDQECGGMELACKGNGTNAFARTETSVYLSAGDRVKCFVGPWSEFFSNPHPSTGSLTVIATPVSVWDEQLDGGEDSSSLLEFSQVVSGNGPLDRIVGKWDAVNDVDTFQVQVCDHAAFSATSAMNATFPGSMVGTYPKLSLYNHAGNLVTLTATEGEAGWTLSGDTLSNGIYTLKVTLANPNPDFPVYRIALTGVCRVDTPAPCAADFNHVNGVTVQDIFDFLTAWLAGNPSANFNGVNGVTVQDIFDFLTAWLAGC